MKALWCSNHPESASGYGSQTRQVGRRLLAAGHDVVFQCNWGQAGMITRWEGALVLGQGKDRYSRDVIAESYRRFNRDWAITLYDGWVYDEGAGEKNDPFRDAQAAGWLPVDHQPVPPTVVSWAQRHFTIAMSRFGQREFQNAGVDARYIPHAVEPVFRPTPELPNRPTSFRAMHRIPEDAFLVHIVAANVGTRHHDRKSWAEMLRAFSMFAKRHDDVFLYLHTQPMGPEGVPLPVLVAGLEMSDRVRWADEWALIMGAVSDADMAWMYSAGDVLLATSRGEGFCVPLIEAQACGLPVIVSDFTAQPELVGAGWKVPVAREFDWKHGADYGIPVVPEIAACLEDAYNRRGNEQIRIDAMNKAAEYGADLVFDQYWKPVLAEMEAKGTALAKPLAPSRAVRRASKKKGRAA